MEAEVKKQCNNHTNKINMENKRKNAPWVFSWRQNCRQPHYFSTARGLSYWNCTSLTETEQEISAYKNEVPLEFCRSLSARGGGGDSAYERGGDARRLT